MSVREAGDGDHQSHQEMVEIKTLLKVLVESQLNTQNQILDILKSTGNSGNNYQKDDHKAFQNPLSSSKCPKPQARMLSPSIEFEEITRALPEDDRNLHYQQRPFEHRLGEFTGNHTTMEQNLKYKGENGMSKKYVLNGYKQLYFAAYNGDWEKASKFFENNPQAIREVVTEEQETALHIAAHRNHLVFIEEIVSCMPPEVLEYKTRYTKSTALHFAVMHGNLKAAEVMYKKNQKLTQIQDGDGLVPLEYALVCATGAQEEMVKYLYPITKDDDPSPFSGHRGASMLCDAISEGFYDLASSLVERFPELVSTKSKWSKQYGVEVLVEKPFTFLSGAGLTWWERCINPLIQVDMDAARGHDSQVDEKNPWGIDDGEENEKGKCSERTGSDEENPLENIIEGAGSSLKSSKGIEGDEEDLLESSEVSVSTSKDSSMIKFMSIFFMPYLMRVPHIEQLYNKKLMHQQAVALVQNMLRQLDETMNRKEIKDFFDSSTAIKTAIKLGSTEFIVASLEKFSYLITHEMSGQTMAQMAVEERNDTIFIYLCEAADAMGIKMDLVSKTDRSYSTILHYAAKLAPSAKLNLVSGAALQMQRELQWFKCVESILRKKHRLKTNIDGDTAQHIFTEENKGLVEKGEKWMKDTSGSCMVVAALIATVTFQAAFTVPGGYINDINSSKNGTPVFLETTSFTVFVVADALALFSSVTSVLMFFAIYTSRYAEEDFYKSLPRKLIIGLGTLFISMATILVAFSASLVMLLGGRFSWALIPISLFSCVPVFLFALLQLPLFVEIVCSAYWGSLFSKHRYIHRTGNQYNAKRKGK